MLLSDAMYSLIPFVAAIVKASSCAKGDMRYLSISWSCYPNLEFDDDNPRPVIEAVEWKAGQVSSCTRISHNDLCRISTKLSQVKEVFSSNSSLLKVFAHK